ncbi:MAG: Bifunctional purine biosynthesis protein PurH [Candidatus Omnitrophica bacterium]|nr:Bifunctional purine biosynthesis protein PurH [Candidatus Omnitrophota bacterium]
MIEIKRALISVYDKTGVVELARGLGKLGVEILSTGGTAELLRKEGVAVREVSEVTGFPEMLDGRVKTLHPMIHGGLLARRSDPAHMRTAKQHGIGLIDLLVVNLYPFTKTLESGAGEEEVIEMIDIGGPAMLRAAAKNHEGVAALCDPADYATVLEQVRATGRIDRATLKRLAAKVFRHTSAYDAKVADYLTGASQGLFPETWSRRYRKAADLRYGENPHQKAALYADADAADKGGVVSARQLHGKELSFNNYLDLDSAWDLVTAFDEPACAIIKHMNPCGFALGKDALGALKKAYACDALSAFGGIYGFNRPVDERLAAHVLKCGFIECVIAPSFAKKAVELLSVKKNLRLLEARPGRILSGMDFKRVRGGLLVQQEDTRDVIPQDLKAVSGRMPSGKLLADLLFAFKTCRYLRSNAIVIAKDGATVGMGMGLPSRVDACLTAVRKAGTRSKGAVLASDGFFPKPDSIALARKAGIRAIIQPGGSVQDEEVIKACSKAGIAMVFTGVRHFTH